VGRPEKIGFHSCLGMGHPFSSANLLSGPPVTGLMVLDLGGGGGGGGRPLGGDLGADRALWGRFALGGVVAAGGSGPLGPVLRLTREQLVQSSELT